MDKSSKYTTLFTQLACLNIMDKLQQVMYILDRSSES